MLPVNKDLLALQMKKERLTLNKQLDWLRVRTNQNRMERLKKINDETKGRKNLNPQISIEGDIENKIVGDESVPVLG